MSFIILKVLVIRTKPILVKQKDIWQLGLGSIFQDIQPFLNIYIPAAHVIILPLRIFILCHMVTIILNNKVKEALYIKKQKPLLNKHLHQHGASFLLNVF